MNTTSSDIERVCREHIACYFRQYPNEVTSKQAMKAVRFITAGERPLSGKAEGWAAGIVYYLANRDRQACGVPGLLNSDMESFFGVTMSTIRKRAARVEDLLII